jgi:hypothetical protein
MAKKHEKCRFLTKKGSKMAKKAQYGQKGQKPHFPGFWSKLAFFDVFEAASSRLCSLNSDRFVYYLVCTFCAKIGAELTIFDDFSHFLGFFGVFLRKILLFCLGGFNKRKLLQSFKKKLCELFFCTVLPNASTVNLSHILRCEIKSNCSYRSKDIYSFSLTGVQVCCISDPRSPSSGPHPPRFSSACTPRTAHLRQKPPRSPGRSRSPVIEVSCRRGASICREVSASPVSAHESYAAPALDAD